MEPGTYRVELRKAGYKTWTTTITLDKGESREIRATLSEIPAPPAKLLITSVIGGFIPPTINVRVTVENPSSKSLSGTVTCRITNRRTGKFDISDKRVTVNAESTEYLLFQFVDYAARRGDRIDYVIQLNGKIEKTGSFTL